MPDHVARNVWLVFDDADECVGNVVLNDNGTFESSKKPGQILTTFSSLAEAVHFGVVHPIIEGE
jgi:hypothetical protein